MTRLLYLAGIFAVFIFFASFSQNGGLDPYDDVYGEKLEQFKDTQDQLIRSIESADLNEPQDVATIRMALKESRVALKKIDFWLRYLEPIAYKKINGPLPVEWETEVFEKFEVPYKREGAGLTLAELYLDEPDISRDTLLSLIRQSRNASEVFSADSVTSRLQTHHNFFFCNRLFLLNLAAVYTTGFECPNPEQVIPELKVLMASVDEIYRSYDQTFPKYPIDSRYKRLFAESLKFVRSRENDRDSFDHFEFIQQFVNPLFALNQEMIRRYQVVSGSYNDYSINNTSSSIFDKSLFFAQNPKGIYYSVQDEKILEEIKQTGKLFFYDPLLSGNVKRSCASCHRPAEYFTDTTVATALQFNERDRLARNTPTLINVVYQHLVNQDGKHFNLQNQAKDVVTNSQEMGAAEDEVLQRIMSCGVYKTALKRYSGLTPYNRRINLEHITSALTLYYSDFSRFLAPFDDAMTHRRPVSEEVRSGFNLFMGKAGCGTCHFVPQFNGVKPPYTGSEFEVVGTPEKRDFKVISGDAGRFRVHPAEEMFGAFRTGTIRNSSYTKPYMHNGVFWTLEEVIDFYDTGGGVGRGLPVKNQTLSPDSLKLTSAEKKSLLAFFRSLDENISLPTPPERLPSSSNKLYNSRKVGGEY